MPAEERLSSPKMDRRGLIATAAALFMLPPGIGSAATDTEAWREIAWLHQRGLQAVTRAISLGLKPGDISQIILDGPPRASLPVLYFGDLSKSGYYAVSPDEAYQCTYMADYPHG